MTTADTLRLDRLDACIRTAWVREQKLHLVAGLLTLLTWAVPMFLLFMLIDWLTYMPSAGRVVMLLVLIGVSLQRAWQRGWRQLRPFDAVRTALKLEAHHQGVNSLLVSAIQMRESSAGGGSQSLRNHTCKLAEQAAASLQPGKAVPYTPLQRPGAFTGGLAALLVVFAILNAAFLAAGLARIFTPWTNLEYPTDTQITLAQDELIIKEGDAAQITAALTGVVPDSAVIYVKTGEAKPRAIDLDVDNDTCTYTIASASRDFTYRIKAGDDRTQWQSVRVVPAPRITDVDVSLTYPDYLDKPKDTLQALTLTMPEGTAVDWRITLDRPIQSAQLIRDEQDPVDLAVGEDGRTVAFDADVAASQGYQFAWVDQEHGFAFTSPRYFLQVASDQSPRVELTQPPSNIVAMLGRPMDLTVRAQDDHGIGQATLDYRVNQRDPVSIPSPNPVKAGDGEQPIGWDYRDALPDLEIGDTVTFSVRVSDRYPGQAGPHTARSETRRITFLSKEQYLEQIEKQISRLLSRVQTIYRQQRSAHETVLALEPGDTGFMQACQMEAIRQEMLREQLGTIAQQIQGLQDDLALNNVADAPQGESLEMIKNALRDLSEAHIAKAADLLREQSAGGPPLPPTGVSPAAREVNASARELAALVLLRSIDSAQEVYAREARMIAQYQASLRWTTATADEPDRAALAEHQNELADWTDRLTGDLRAGMSYGRRPLAVLRLTRSVKDLQEAGASASMREAGDLVRAGKADEALSRQAALVRTLLNAEFSVRLSGAYSTVLKTRDQIRQLARRQTSLRQATADLSLDAFAEKQAELADQQDALREQLLTLMLPTIPAPRATLFDQSVPVAPPVEAVLGRADTAMTSSLAQLGAGDKAKAAEAQARAGAALAELAEIVSEWSVEMGLRTQGLGTLVAASSERMSRVEDYEARVFVLLEKTDIAAAEEKKVDTLAEQQLDLAEELSEFHAALSVQAQAEQDKDLPPLLSRLDEAARALHAATQSLKDNDADQAIGQQEQAADSLAEALAIVTAQNQRLALLQSLLLFQREIAFANGYMADIVAEQRDLLAATKAADAAENQADKDLTHLLPVFANMRQCMEDVAPLLTLVAGRLDIGTPLAFAKTDFDDAMISLKSGDFFDAIDAQDVAAESLGDVQLLVQDIRAQAGYVAEVVQVLHRASSDTALLQHRQQQLRARALAPEAARHATLAQDQAQLLADTQTMNKMLGFVTGMPDFAEPVEQMRQARSLLESGDLAAAAEPMQQAQTLLMDSQEMLFIVIEMLHGLPSIEITDLSEPALIRLVDALAVASDHKQLLRETSGADADALEALAERQAEIAESSARIAGLDPAHPMLDAANTHLAQAASAMQAGDYGKARQSQADADLHLRHFIVEQALILETKVPPAVASDAPATDGPGSDEESAISAGFISDFVSGEAPTDQRTEWKVLGERNRAALNQNFARELPLEYRALLKDYYERVAK